MPTCRRTNLPEKASAEQRRQAVRPRQNATTPALLVALALNKPVQEPLAEPTARPRVPKAPLQYADLLTLTRTVARGAQGLRRKG